MDGRPIRLGVLLALAVTSASAQERADGWIGKAVPPYPDGVVQQQGSCIGDGREGSGPEAMCRHMVDVVHDPQARLRTVLVVTELPHFGPHSIGLVSDALDPAELDDDAMQVAVATCRVGGRGDGRVVAIVLPREVEWLRAHRAWRVDVDGKLQALAADAVECLNEGFGYDG